MDTTAEERLAEIEETLRQLALRVERLERERAPGVTAAEGETPQKPKPVTWERTAPAETAFAPRPVARTPTPRPRKAPAPRAPEIALEDLLGGRILAWVGGLAVVLAASFFVATAVRRGWIDIPTRIGLAFLGSSILVVLGAWLYEAKGQTQAAQALVASGISALYLTLVAATQVYDLIPAAFAFIVAGIVGIVAATIAVRWNSRLVAALGIGGALLAPVLVAAGVSTSALAFMVIATTAAVGVLVWRSWTWLGVMTFVIVTPQLLGWVVDEHETQLGLTLGVLMLFWALYLGAAAGFEMRVPSARLRVGAGLLTSLDAILVTAAGWAVLDATGHGDASTAWVLVFAAIHVAIGLGSRASARINSDFGTIAITLGLAYSAVGLALALDGAALVAGWAAEAVGLAIVARARGDMRVAAASLGFLVLAAGHTLIFDAPPSGLAGGSYDTSEALFAIAFTLVASIGLAGLLPGVGKGELEPQGWLPVSELPLAPERLDVLLPAFSLGTFTYLVGYAFDGTVLVAALVLTAVGLAVAGRALDERLTLGGLFPLGVAAVHVLDFEAPPRALFLGVDDLGAAALSLTCVIAGAALVGVLTRTVAVRRALLGSAGVGTLYLASVAIVDLWGVNESGDRLQGGQLAMSALWAATGVALVVVGLLRDLVWLRRAGLGLLVVAVAKVFTYDLTELTDLARVASLLVIGLVLIAAAYFYQRLRSQHPVQWRHP
jgi:uncharacterized membrane protein